MPIPNVMIVLDRCSKHRKESGIRTLADLAGLGEDDLVGLGVRRPFARQILGYVHRRFG